MNFSQFVEMLIEFYPELEETSKEILDLALETLLDTLNQFGKF
jgi:hypothetical protein